MTSLSPARKQYLEFKKQFPDAILMYQVGDFFETFDEDAYTTARELQIVRTTRSYSKGKERVPLAGIPKHALDNYIGKLIQRGYKVVICEQTSELQKGQDVVERAVTRILTAGTLSEPNLLPARQNNYLVAIAPGRTQTGLASVDVSTGEFQVTWFTPDELPVALDAELQRLAPVECLLVEGSNAEDYQFPSKSMTVTHCPAYFYQQEAAQTRLCRQFGVQSLTAYGCANEPQAIAAAGAIIAYVEKMNSALLSLLTALNSYSTKHFMILDAHTQRNLELLQGTRSGSLQGSLLGVLDRTITPMGARQLRRTITQPLLDLTELNGRLECIEELYESPAIRNRFTMSLQELGDLERVSGRIRQGTAVRNEVLGLRDYLAELPTLRDLLQSCESELLLAIADELDPCPQVSELIQRSLLHPDEELDEGDNGRLIRPGYHAELDELFNSIRDSRRWMISLEARERQRTGIKALKVGFNKVFGYYIEVSNANLKLVPDDYMRKQTLVNAERYITPELKEHEARILSAVENIEELERSIYADVLRQIAAFYPQLMTTAHAVARIDVLLSLAEVAAHQGYVRPMLEQGHRLDIVGGRHPVVEYTLDGDMFIPNDTHMEAADGERILLLTGPNMAGKSTYLRQVALISLLAQLGSFVPARKAQIGLVDRIFTRVGAEDDIASGKSTFMVEMEETATIINHATSHSLIILDEIGRGTSTYDGLAIARAVVEHLHNEVKARTLFATHYHELAALATELSHLRVYTVAISEDEADGIVFLHRVVPGCAERSFGVHVARLAGMPGSIVQRAETVLAQLETSQPGGGASYSLSHDTLQVARIAEADAVYKPAHSQSAAFSSVYWQSEAARRMAEAVEKNGREPSLDEIDVQAITPLDALNLLSLLQQKKKNISHI
ncbi:DNA mismatch repair protein MutS [Dictyobacter vulcani]|uniref:DNA mismatch repair protein MutS n=1 Tax=Dictyobacter vulcani TaxID=2607529 RepID=A0A5J4KT51_9CHLR|nr:DNA mismatch repair protein MutS [Dictyobacter vulcani]GER89229.1 DNA mismatch repair protein MutS [Dictyobacter vulcani]